MLFMKEKSFVSLTPCNSKLQQNQEGKSASLTLCSFRTISLPCSNSNAVKILQDQSITSPTLGHRGSTLCCVSNNTSTRRYKFCSKAYSVLFSTTQDSAPAHTHAKKRIGKRQQLCTARTLCMCNSTGRWYVVYVFHLESLTDCFRGSGHGW